MKMIVGEFIPSKGRLKVGDRIQLSIDPEHIREITEVRRTGYTWKYVDRPDEDYWSENSNDQFFRWYGKWVYLGAVNDGALKPSATDTEI